LKSLSGETLHETIEYLINGETIYYQYSLNPIYQKNTIVGLTIIGRNITLLKTNENKVNEIKGFYEMIFEKMPISVSVYDSKLQYIYANPSSIKNNEHRQLSIGKTDIELAYLIDQKHENALIRYDIMREISHTLDYFEIIEPIESKNSETKYILRSYTPVVADNKIQYIITFGTDITRLKSMEAEIAVANEVKEKALKVKQQFLSIMSHEIRTPLNAVVSLSEFLVADKNSPDALEKLSMLKIATEQIQNLVNDVLDYSKIEAGKIELEDHRFDLHLLLKLEYESFKESVKNKGIELVIKVDESIPRYLNGDQYRLQQVLNNLLSNAIKFTSEGCVSLLLKCVSKDDDLCSIEFKVIDTGIGVAEDKLDQIFDVFTQAETSTTRRFGGSGLGLSIVKKILLLLGTDIKVSSTPNKGTMFVFTILYKLGSETEIVNNSIDFKAKLSGKFGLVVDDNPINIYVVKKHLSAYNIEIDSAENGLQAYEKVQVNNYDFVLMDIQMPVMDGFESTQKIRTLDDSTKSSIKIIGFTADGIPETLTKVFDSGMNDYVLKPLKIETLLSSICSLID
jgi:signal transduction histidine kinase/CheY-like chemotaxis protein